MNMDVAWFWACWCAATLVWAMALGQCRHAYSRVLVGIWGGRVWLASTMVGLVWSAYRLLSA